MLAPSTPKMCCTPLAARYSTMKSATRGWQMGLSGVSCRSAVIASPPGDLWESTHEYIRLVAQCTTPNRTADGNSAKPPTRDAQATGDADSEPPCAVEA